MPPIHRLIPRKDKCKPRALPARILPFEPEYIDEVYEERKVILPGLTLIRRRSVRRRKAEDILKGKPHA